MSEDCLYLNVWTPETSATEKLPVLVWIYGGGFNGGATSYPVHDGAKLAKRGVVLVSVAYPSRIACSPHIPPPETPPAYSSAFLIRVKGCR